MAEALIWPGETCLEPQSKHADETRDVTIHSLMRSPGMR